MSRSLPTGLNFSSPIAKFAEFLCLRNVRLDLRAGNNASFAPQERIVADARICADRVIHPEEHAAGMWATQDRYRQVGFRHVV